jgi:hypothetical protein
MVTLRIFLISLFLLSAVPAVGQTSPFLEGLTFDEPQTELGTFVVPNEVNPELARPIFDQLPKGAYLSVGTERGFIGAALSPNVDHLVFLDRDPKVILFDKINVELLRLATSREDYVQLRLHASPKEILHRVSEAEASTGEKFDFLSAKANIKWWTEYARLSKFHDFNVPPKESPLAAFRNSNYLFDDTLFHHIKKMADDGNIKAFEVNFSNDKKQLNEEALTKLFQALRRDRVDVSIFDFSNVWYEKYLGRQPTQEIIDLMQEYGVVQPKSVFMVTDWKKIQYYSKGERAKRPFLRVISEELKNNGHEEYDWRYHGFTFDQIKSNPPNLTTFPDYSSLNGARLDGATPLKSSLLGCFLSRFKSD